MRVSKLSAPLGRGASKTWSATGTPMIISESQAAARLFMSPWDFSALAERHGLAAMRDGTGETFRSIAELEALASKLGLSFQQELPWGDAA